MVRGPSILGDLVDGPFGGRGEGGGSDKVLSAFTHCFISVCLSPSRAVERNSILRRSLGEYILVGTNWSHSLPIAALVSREPFPNMNLPCGIVQ